MYCVDEVSDSLATWQRDVLKVTEPNQIIYAEGEK